MGPPTPGDYQRIYFSDRGAWREWLENNHALEPGIWVVFYKRGAGKQTMKYEESVEEAICFGWVDSRKRRLDDRRYALMFTPRNPRSPWSRTNKERVRRLVASGMMAEAGMACIEEARRNGAWAAYDPIEDLVVPEDLAVALAGRRSARENFEGLTVSARKSVLWWIATARRSDTRARRITKTAEAASQNRSPI